MNKTRIALTIILFFFGIITTTQYQSFVISSSDLSNHEQAELAAMARELTTKKRIIDEEITQLERKLNQITSSQSSQGKTSEELLAEINKLKKLNGSTALKGPGIIMTIDGNSPVIYTDLVKLINELWNTGAEGIEINGHRITSRTYFFQSEETYQMTINNNLLEAPYTIKALGNPKVLKNGIELPGGIIDILHIYGIYPEINTIPELILQASDREINFSYAREAN